MKKHAALIIEDDPTLNEIISITLRVDFEIETTADKRQAETMTDQGDIVLLKPVSPAQFRELTLRLRSM